MQAACGEFPATLVLSLAAKHNYNLPDHRKEPNSSASLTELCALPGREDFKLDSV